MKWLLQTWLLPGAARERSGCQRARNVGQSPTEARFDEANVPTFMTADKVITPKPPPPPCHLFTKASFRPLQESPSTTHSRVERQLKSISAFEEVWKGSCGCLCDLSWLVFHNPLRRPAGGAGHRAGARACHCIADKKDGGIWLCCEGDDGRNNIWRCRTASAQLPLSLPHTPLPNIHANIKDVQYFKACRLLCVGGGR